MLQQAIIGKGKNIYLLKVRKHCYMTWCIKVKKQYLLPENTKRMVTKT